MDVTYGDTSKIDNEAADMILLFNVLISNRWQYYQSITNCVASMYICFVQNWIIF